MTSALRGVGQEADNGTTMLRERNINKGEGGGGCPPFADVITGCNLPSAGQSFFINLSARAALPNHNSVVISVICTQLPLEHDSGEGIFQG